MRRMLLAGMLALPFLLATAATASAQAPISYGGAGYGSGGGGYVGPFGGRLLGAPPAGHFSLGYRIFPLIHQEGPLVNYGPFSGYYPFEPYGPWTSDLRYTGSLQAPPGHFAKHHGAFGGAGGGGATGLLRLGELSGGGHGHGGIHQSPCGSCSSNHTWGSYSLATLKNVGHRIHGPQSTGCSNCHSAIQPAEPIQAASLSLTER